MRKNVLMGLLLAAGLVMSAQASDFLADRHATRGVACAACHDGQATPAPGSTVKSETCLSCHGPAEKLAERTKKVDPNPHYNHLIDVGCLECHRGHKQSVNMCSSCHNIHYKVP